MTQTAKKPHMDTSFILKNCMNAMDTSTSVNSLPVFQFVVAFSFTSEHIFLLREHPDAPKLQMDETQDPRFLSSKFISHFRKNVPAWSLWSFCSCFSAEPLLQRACRRWAMVHLKVNHLCGTTDLTFRTRVELLQQRSFDIIQLKQQQRFEKDQLLQKRVLKLHSKATHTESSAHFHTETGSKMTRPAWNRTQWRPDRSRSFSEQSGGRKYSSTDKTRWHEKAWRRKIKQQKIPVELHQWGLIWMYLKAFFMPIWV